MNSSLPIGSAHSNITAPLNSSARKGLSFHHQFSSSYQDKYSSPDGKRKSKYRENAKLDESPLTHKQKQLEEFTINLKQNKINKYGKVVEETASPMLNSSLRRRVDNGKTKSILKTSGRNDDYTPSVFENKAKFSEKRAVTISHDNIKPSFYQRMHK